MTSLPLLREAVAKMTQQALHDIDDLIAWLDGEQDGAEDAGFIARSATNWHPALIALKRSYSALLQCPAEVDAEMAVRWAARYALLHDRDTITVADLVEETTAAWFAAKAMLESTHD